MKPLITVALHQYKLLWRKRSLPGLAVAMVIICCITFFSATGDKSLAGELQLRWLYAQGLSYYFLMFAVLALSAFSARNQIDEHNMHLLGSSSTARWQIFCGQALGCAGAAITLLFVLYLSLLGCSKKLWESFPEEQQAQYSQTISSPSQLLRPATKERLPLTIDFCERNKIQMPPGMPTAIWKEFYLTAKKEVSQLKAGQVKDYPFNAIPLGVETQLQLKPFSSYHRMVKMKIEILNAEGRIPYWEKEQLITPYVLNKFTLPKDALKESKLILRVHNKSNQTINLDPYADVSLLLSNSSLSLNLVCAFCTQALHLSILCLVGVLCGLALTFAVSTFTSFSLFIVSIGAGFSEKIAQDLLFHYDVPLNDLIGARSLQTVSLLLRGISPPPLIQDLSTNIALASSSELFLLWLPAALLSSLLLIGLGSLMLTRKELSKLEV